MVGNLVPRLSPLCDPGYEVGWLVASGWLLCISLPEVRARIQQAVFPMSYANNVQIWRTLAMSLISRLSSMNLGSSGDDIERSELTVLE